MSLQRGPKNENNIGAAWAVFRIVDSVHSSGTWDYHLGRSEEKMIKYVVEINYYNFTFNDAADAVRFAISAKTHCDKGPDDISVGIVLEDVPGEDPDE